jgi:hypothetical protein
MIADNKFKSNGLFFLSQGLAAALKMFNSGNGGDLIASSAKSKPQTNSPKMDISQSPRLVDARESMRRLSDPKIGDLEANHDASLYYEKYSLEAPPVVEGDEEVDPLDHARHMMRRISDPRIDGLEANCGNVALHHSGTFNLHDPPVAEADDEEDPLVEARRLMRRISDPRIDSKEAYHNVPLYHDKFHINEPPLLETSGLDDKDENQHLNEARNLMRRISDPHIDNLEANHDVALYHEKYRDHSANDLIIQEGDDENEDGDNDEIDHAEFEDYMRQHQFKAHELGAINEGEAAAATFSSDDETDDNAYMSGMNHSDAAVFAGNTVMNSEWQNTEQNGTENASDFTSGDPYMYFELSPNRDSNDAARGNDSSDYQHEQFGTLNHTQGSETGQHFDLTYTGDLNGSTVRDEVTGSAGYVSDEDEDEHAYTLRGEGLVDMSSGVVTEDVVQQYPVGPAYNVVKMRAKSPRGT